LTNQSHLEDVRALPGNTCADMDAIQRRRGLIFQQMVYALDLAEDRVADTRSSVWSPVSMIPKPVEGYRVRRHRDSIIFTRHVGDHAFNYSIAVRIGDVRIGMTIPLSLPDMSIGAFSEKFHWSDLYPQPAATTPQVAIRPLSSQSILVDHIFTARMGSEASTRAALNPESSVQDALLLGDALAQELIHINHGIMHVLGEMDYLVTDLDIAHLNGLDALLIESEDNREAILDHLEVDPTRLAPASRNRYFVMVPMQGDERERILRVAQNLLVRDVLA